MIELTSTLGASVRLLRSTIGNFYTTCEGDRIRLTYAKPSAFDLMADIFISYAKPDRALALKLAAMLEAEGSTASPEHWRSHQAASIFNWRSN
jgi:hypothetical protein